MIQSLSISNFIVVKEAKLSFQSGLTVITGETGSGKSVLLQALDLILGARSDASLIQPGATSATIAASFDLKGLNEASDWITSMGIDHQSSCVIERIINQSGRTKITLNEKVLTLQQLKLFGAMLIQIHGQHQHQNLVRASEQRHLLDAYAQNKNACLSVKASYEHWLSCVEKKESLQAKGLDLQGMALLQYQLDELDKLQPTDGEWFELTERQNELSNADELQGNIISALDLLETNEENNITSMLHQVKQLCTALNDENLMQLLSEANIQLSETILALEPLQDRYTSDPEALATIEHRLSQWFDLSRKHQVSPESLYEHAEHLRDQHQILIDAEDALSKIDEEIEQAHQSYLKAAALLRESRDKARVTLARSVTTLLQSLGMQGSAFDIELKAADTLRPSPHGSEQVQFIVRTNPDHPFQPLAKVASGGELSRMSLAIQSVTSDVLHRQVMVFDEVDVGISGKTGAIVGQRLRALGQQAQVLCVTHLPQVAAQAHHHYSVQKTLSGTKSVSTIYALNDIERIEEIARMLGGVDVSKQAREHAKSLLTIE